MNKKALIIAGALLLTTGLSSWAQSTTTKFNLNGLGRAVVTNNKLDGNLIEGDNTSINKGLSGYTLFDLGTNVEVNELFKANAIFRVRQPFGAFFGDQTSFQFRQFQLKGKVKSIDYEIGDINVEMTPYTVYNPDVMFNTYESDVLRMRTDILEYENFNFGNSWRLQGIHGGTQFDFDKTIQSIGIYGFATRTNSTNDADISDRLLVGGTATLKQSDKLSIMANYVGLQDVQIETADYNYVNHVLTGQVQYTMDKDNYTLGLDWESGISSYDYIENASNAAVSYNDFFYDVNAKFELKSAKVQLFAGYREVGAQFTNPAAQTRRIDITNATDLFTSVQSASINREQILFDRVSDESIYNRSINPLLLTFLPQYGNVTPYGQATPNRTGITAGVKTTDSSKFVQASLKAQLLSEVQGEGTVDLRKFTAVEGGAAFDAGKFLELDRLVLVKAGARYENTTRDGLAGVDFSSLLIDAGVTVETAKNLDLMVGAKLLSASGSEYLASRDNYNFITSFSQYEADINESIISLGARVRFNKNSNFTATYNTSGFKNNTTNTEDYNINQLFLNYTLIF